MLADAAETGLFDCISHPDLIKNENPDNWHPELILPEIARALDRIARTGVAMELNTSGRLKKIAEMNPFPEMLALMAEREIPVVLGADAHVPERVGDHYGEALELLASVGYQCVHYFVDRQPRSVTIPDALALLRREAISL
jgi:histidinol-phosphatase (PHP family)